MWYVQHEGPWKEDDSSTGDESDIASDERWSDQDTCNDSDEEGNQEASQLLIDFQTAGADLHENQADRAGLEVRNMYPLYHKNKPKAVLSEKPWGSVVSCALHLR